MNRTFLVTVITAGVMAATSVMAQQPQEETVPLQLKAGQVMEMQQTLNKQGFSAGRTDGLWGPNTSAAVMKFQEKNGLQSTGQLDQRTLMALGVVGAPAASPAMPAQNTTVPAMNTPPGAMAGNAVDRTPATSATAATPGTSAPDSATGTAVGRAADGTLGTNTTGTNPASTNTGTAAASGNDNQAVATTNANAPQPAHGANSFTKGQATARFERRGFQNVSSLRKDNGVWRGTATKDGQQISVWLDYKGNVGQQ